MIFIVFKVNAKYTINLTEGAIMKKIKLIPFYLLLALNGFLVFIYAITYPKEMSSNQMPWNAEALGWAYENKFNYTIFTIIDLLIIIAPTIYAWKKRKTNLVKAYIILSIPALVYLARYIYFTNFYNI